MTVASRRPRESTLVQKYTRMNTILVLVFYHLCMYDVQPGSADIEVAIAVRL